MHAAAEAAQPITGRGIGYKLFTQGLIASMAKSETQRVYRVLREARERGIIPWEWIVDEARAIEAPRARTRRLERDQPLELPIFCTSCVMPVALITQAKAHPHVDRGRDLYETPAVATLARVERVPKLDWEPAAGRGAIVRVLESTGRTVVSTDIETDDNFLTCDHAYGAEGIVTNPPFRIAAQQTTEPNPRKDRLMNKLEAIILVHDPKNVDAVINALNGPFVDNKTLSIEKLDHLKDPYGPTKFLRVVVETALDDETFGEWLRAFVDPLGGWLDESGEAADSLDESMEQWGYATPAERAATLRP